MKGFWGTELALFIAVLGTLWASEPAQAFNPAVVNWSDTTDEVLVKDQVFDGTWAKAEGWDGVLCNGHYRVGARAKGRIEKADFDLRPDGTLAVYANLITLRAWLSGEYRSELSLCATVGLQHLLTANRAEAWAQARFIEKGENQVPDVRVRVLETRLYGLEVADFLPDFLNEEINTFANDMLRQVWAGHLGRWINEKVARAIKEKLPKPDQSR